MRTNPPGVWALALEADRPVPLVFHNPGSDSDRDGREDGATNAQAVGNPFVLSSQMGEILALRDDLALVSMSGYEQLLVYDPSAPRSATC